MIADALLGRLEKVAKIGPDRWKACCPAHPDRRPSLLVREVDDRVLVHCFAGCGVDSVLGAVGLDFTDLYPPREPGSGKSIRHPWSAADMIHVLDLESRIVLIAACDAILAGTIHRDHLPRIIKARERIAAVSEFLP